VIIVGIVLSFFGIGFLCWLMFTLAVQALPFYAGVTAGFAAYHSGAGEIGAILVGLIAGAATLAAGQIAIAMVRSPLIRVAITLLFTLPAAVAGYHAVLGLTQIAVPAEGWRQAFALIGAFVVGGTAWMRMALSALDEAGRGDVAGLKSEFSVASGAKGRLNCLFGMSALWSSR
jgi:hypothetical protein